MADSSPVAQAPTEEGDSTTIFFTQHFAIDKDSIVATAPLIHFSEKVDSIMRVDTIKHVSIIGVASIDGPVSLNNRLAEARAQAMSRFLQQNAHIPADIITTAGKGEDWAMFRRLVDADQNIPARRQLISILNTRISPVAQENKIRALDRGNTWAYLAKNIFPEMRCAEVTLDVKHRFIVPIPEEIIEMETVEAVEEEPVIEAESEPEPEVEPTTQEEEWRRRFYIKTDLPYWLMTWSNIAFEIDLAPHWSFNLPIYFSAMNYFKPTIKFRTFSFQPGVRYWFRPDNMGAYLEAHYGMGWWNFAFGGDYRYQDHYRKTPTMGGGVAGGYRIYVTKNHRWTMEFGAGVGVYHLNYDRFQNRQNGKLIDSHKKTVFFLDNLNVSIGYSFPVQKKKGGEK